MSGSLHEQVVEVASRYLGPAGRRFVRRQIKAHLGKEPDDLTPDDIPVLANWSKMALGLITRDKQEVDQFEADLLALVKASSSAAGPDH